MATLVQHPPTLNKSLPTTPAHEWATQTNDVLQNHNSSAPSTPAVGGGSRPISYFADSAATTPGHMFPGYFPRTAPEDRHVEPVNFNIDPRAMMDSAWKYLPQWGDVASYFPQKLNVIPGLGSQNQQNSTADPNLLTPTRLSPTRASSGLTNLSTKAQAGSQDTPKHTGSDFGSTDEFSLPAATPKDASSESQAEVKSTSGDSLNIQTVSASPEQMTPQPQTKEVELEQPTINPVPRTHNLGKEGTEWQGQPLDKELPTDSASLHEQLKNDNVPPKSSADESTVVHTGHSKDDSQSQPEDPSRSENAGVPQKSPADESTVGNTGHSKDDTESQPKEGPFPTHPPGLHPSELDSPLSPSSGEKASSSSFSNSSGSSGGSPSSGFKRTPTKRFMNKIKGEVKVISGRLGRNEAKVEEGRRLMRAD